MWCMALFHIKDSDLCRLKFLYGDQMSGLGVYGALRHLDPVETFYSGNSNSYCESLGLDSIFQPSSNL